MRLRVCMVLVLLLNGVPGSLVGDGDMHMRVTWDQ
jgi:hypothetical protein